MPCAVLGAAGAMAVTSSRMDVLADDAAGNPAGSIDRTARLRQGEWLGPRSLTSVQPREATIKQGERSEVLARQRPDAATSPPADAGGRLTMPGSALPSFAPFVPRATSKIGESDGL